MWPLWVVGIVVGFVWGGYKSRIVRGIGVFVAFVGILIVAVSQTVSLSPGSAASPPEDSSIIRDYALEYVVAADGGQRLVETLDVEFTEEKHGIYRFFDESDGVDPDVTHPVTVESVELCSGRALTDCSPEPYQESYEGDFLVAKIGRQAVTYPAGTVNRYVITSSTQGAITQPWGSATDQWYWDVIGAGWAMPIRRAEVTVEFPVTPTAVRCITESGVCETRSGRDHVVTGTYSSLAPGVPVTWQADLPPTGLTAVPVGEAPAGPLPWWRSWVLFVPAALLGVLMWFAIRAVRERPASTAPYFAEPSPDILPAVWTYREEAPEHSFQTMLLQLQQAGAVEVQVQTDGPYMSRNPDWIMLQRTQRPLPMIAGASELVDGLGISQPGQSAVLAKNDKTMGGLVKGTTGRLEGLADHSAKAMGYYHRSSAGTAVVVAAALLPMLALAVAVGFGLWWVGLGLLVPAVVGLWAAKSLTTELTHDGLTVRDEVTGLHTALSTPASVERFDYAAKAQYFAQFLPWAVALGCAEKWADACKPDIPLDDPQWRDNPAYLSAWNTYNMSQIVSTSVASVAAGAIAAYTASQASSGGGGGGGGFSSGGGSGGGGGGSW